MQGNLSEIKEKSGKRKLKKSSHSVKANQMKIDQPEFRH